MGASLSRLNDRVTADSVSAVTLLQFTFQSAQNSAGAARPSTSVPNPRPGRCLAEKPSRSQTVVDGCKRSKALESARKRSRRYGKVWKGPHNIHVSKSHRRPKQQTPAIVPLPQKRRANSTAADGGSRPKICKKRPISGQINNSWPGRELAGDHVTLSDYYFID